MKTKKQIQRRKSSRDIAVHPPGLSEEQLQRITDEMERLRVLVMSTPGLSGALLSVIHNIGEAFGNRVPLDELTCIRAIMERPLTLHTCRDVFEEIGKTLIEQGIEIGREETLKEYALEALGSVKS